MKKLLTMLAAAAMACGLYAEELDEGFLSGTSFTSWTVGSPVVPATDEGLQWTDLSSESSIGAANWKEGDFGNYGVPVKFQGIPFGNALNIKSGLTEFATVANTEDAQGANIYVDTLVKFTAFDVEDAADLAASKAKLGVWIRENEDGTTNLFVTAGVISGIDVTTAKAYDCGQYTAGEWCRLTIKSLGEISDGYGVYGFVVFVNGTAVTALESDPISYGTLPLTTLAQYYANEKSLFPSIVTQADFGGVLGFAGQGAIDDLVFTTEAPEFAADKASYTIKWDTTHMKDVMVDDKPVSGNSPLVVYEDAPDKITISWTGTNGKASGSKEITNAEGTFEIKTTDLADAAAEFNGNPLTLADAIAAANAATEAGTLKLLANVGAITIENENDVAITLDLGGKNVSVDGIAITVDGDAECNLVITNSAAAGKVTGKVINKGKEATLTIMAGTFDGVVDADGSDGDVIIWGGKFLASANEGLADGAMIMPEGKKLVADGEYLVVGEEQKEYTGPEFKDGAYLITDARDLYWIATNKACRAANFKQTKDITWTSDDGVDGTFPGIGTYKNNASSDDDFTGIYDGQGFSIKDIVLKGSTASNNGKYAGIFNQVVGGTVQNLVVDGVTFADTWDYTMSGTDFAKEIGGAMAIAHVMNGTVKNVTTKGSFGTADKPLTASAGGVVCRVSGGALIEACTNEASLFGAGAKVAGILIIAQSGTDTTTVTIKDCYNSGSINFVNKGRSDTAGGFGGIAAYLGNETAQYIQNCVNVGTINASAQTGGAIGSILGSQRTGTVTATGCSAQADMVGVGLEADATKCTGLDFATVDGNVATFVAAPALDGSYKVMSKYATYAFTGAGSITFDTTLYPSFMPTCPAGYAVTPNDNVFTCALIPVSSVTLDIASTNVVVGDAFTLVATVAPDTVLDKAIVWSVEADPDGCVTVDQAGKVTAVAAGTATVKATSNADSTKSATCTVTVKAAPTPTPVKPGEDIKPDPEHTPDVINDNDEIKAKYLKAPKGVETDKNYRDLFKAVGAMGTGDNTVRFVLNEAGEAAVANAEKAADEVILEKALDSEAKTVTVGSPLKGFYYSLKQGGDLKTIDYGQDDKNKLGGVDTIGFDLVKPEGAGFYQMIVSPSPQE